MICNIYSIGGQSYYLIIPELDPLIYTISSITPIWTQVATEGSSWNSPSYDVLCRYGSGSSWYYSWKQGTIIFSNEVWGDPAPRENKIGQYMSGANVVISPTPVDPYTITIRKYGFSISVEPATAAKVIGSVSINTYTVTINPQSDYDFLGWYNSNDMLITNNTQYSHILNVGLSLTAKLKEKNKDAFIFIKANGKWIPIYN